MHRGRQLNAAVGLGPALLLIFAIGIALLLTACGNSAPPDARSGSPSAQSRPASTPPGMPLRVAPGYTIGLYAASLGTARDLEFSPGGTLLVSDPSAETVTALPDRDRDGRADGRTVVLHGGDNVHGIAFHKGRLYVAQTGRVIRYEWDEARLKATGGRTLLSLPSPNHNHNRRTITFGQDGRMYISVGSTCNVCSEADPRSASILVANADGSGARIFGSGLRNAPFMAINPSTHELWATEMGRDYLGDDLPPDEINIIRESENYGWPRCYGNRVHDTSYDPSSRDPCRQTQAPVFLVPAHSAPLGLAFIVSRQFPRDEQRDLLVAYHGSWNRSSPAGYKVVRLSVRGNEITGSSDVITGFIASGGVQGRPVDLAFDSRGNLYLSDDRAGAVYVMRRTGADPDRRVVAPAGNQRYLVRRSPGRP